MAAKRQKRRPKKAKPKTNASTALVVAGNPTGTRPVYASPARLERPFPLSDEGNCRFFLDGNGRHVRYCAGLGGWHVWDDTRWERDVRNQTLYRARIAMLGLVRMALETADGRADESLARHGLASQRASRLRDLLTLASSEPGIALRADEFDCDPWLLNCLNGTVNLRDSTLRPHDPGDCITKTTGVEYHADAQSDLWDGVLATAMPDPEVRAFFPRAAGYALTGDTSEERVFLVIGPTATSKSTVLGAIKDAMGEYAMTASFETFLHRPANGGPRNDLAALKGARLVVSLETDAGVRLAEGVVKNLTGGDTVSARRLYGEPFEFRPSAKLWLVANDAPKIRDDDGALWRRVVRISFEEVIPEARRDLHLKERLREPEHAAAILRWMVDGCRAWQKDGLGVPEAVKLAAVVYQHDMNALAPFLEDMCEMDPLDATLRCPVKRLREAYTDWARRSGERWPLSQREFKQNLEAWGLRQVNRGGSVRTWEGITLTEEAA